MKAKEENILKEESLKEVVGGQEPAEFDWKAKEYQTPQKEKNKDGWDFEAIGSSPLESDKKEIKYIHIRH